MKLKIIFLLLVLFTIQTSFSLWAYDFGLVTSVKTSFGNVNEENNFHFKTDFWPRFSCLIGDNASFYAAAGIALDYEDTFRIIPELLRTEFTYNSGSWGIKAGRINYADPLSFIAAGLFDGVQYHTNTSIGRFNISAFYTGLLYKETANITMTPEDLNIYNTPLDFSDFSNTYFAPKRLIAAFDWSHPSIARKFRMNVSVIGQFDLSDSDYQYHSQYLVLKGGLPINKFFIEAGFAVQFSQAISDTDTVNNIAFAGDFNFTWLIPANINSSLSFSARVAGGRIDETVGNFVPITTVYFGNILSLKMSGLSILNLNYSARFMEKIAAFLSMSYFIRNDLGTVTGYPISDKKEYFLGAEIYAGFIYKPFSDLQFNLGGGAFLPSLGNASPNEKILWRLELKAVISI
ncbi:MAG: hypothetical protein FWB86_04665 [Treponema sp.]|nr:hypothetical protein [Treponema sp.]MCL2250742.1 hypothetical protein [Treponema sp.]